MALAWPYGTTVPPEGGEVKEVDDEAVDVFPKFAGYVPEVLPLLPLRLSK